MTNGLGLETVGVSLGKKGEVVVNEQLRTSNERIWAAGDVTGHPQFVYVAGVHGAVAVDNALEHAERTVSYRTLPRVTFTTPNIASVGITETEARQAGIECECRSIPLEYVPRAIVNRDTRGLVKIVAESKTGVVRGVHMLAPNAGDAILAGVCAIECGLTVKQVANIWCPYLTIAEGIKLAAQGSRWKSRSCPAVRRERAYFFVPGSTGSALNPDLSVTTLAIAPGVVFDGSKVTSALPLE